MDYPLGLDPKHFESEYWKTGYPTKAIIYYTDNTMDNPLGDFCRKELKKSAGEIPIISVSQKPLSFGKNICVGELGRSHLSMYKQMLEGCRNTDAKIVYMAEHDCLYTPEHFEFEPPKDDVFYYNLNCWFLNACRHTKGQGLYSEPWGVRHASSQLVCNREILIEHLGERIARLEEGWSIRKGVKGVCEPAVNDSQAFIRMHDDGVPISLNWASKWKSDTFRTELPNVDIRHGGNLTGWRRGHNNTDSIPYWGKFSL